MSDPPAADVMGVRASDGSGWFPATFALQPGIRAGRLVARPLANGPELAQVRLCTGWLSMRSTLCRRRRQLI